MSVLDPLKPTRALRRTGLACVAFVVTMVGLAYASVPLYAAFCKATGYDGTPLVGTRGADRVIERTIDVRFDTNVAPGLSWSFSPETPEISTRIGETKTVFFRIRNDGKRPSTGVANFNVQPGPAGAFFVKLQCFCFEPQTLQPGEAIDVPVVFYVDPGIDDEETLKTLGAITLSYTYFSSHDAPSVVSVDTNTPKL